MATQAKEVFLSYGREPEVSAFVKRLKIDLEARGISAWLDTDDIPAGSDWHGAIGTGLQQSKALIAVITTKYLNSKFCTNELYAASSDQKDIFPVILENIDFNAGERARGVKYAIGSINWTYFGTGYDYGTALERLVQGMKRSGLGGTATDAGASPVTNLMDDLHISPHTTGSTPSAPLPPPQPGFSPSSYPAPPAYYSTPGPHTYYPYSSPPQGPMPGYGPSPPTAAPYPTYPPHTPPHPAAGYYQSPYPNSTPLPPPPYTPESIDGAGVDPTLAKTPLSASRGYPSPHLSPSPATHHCSAHQQSTLSSLAGVPSSTGGPLFEVGSKLEATDRRFPYFVCVATIMDRRDSEVLIHFDGWGPEYDYWCSGGSVELHPPGWCHTHNWELQTPLNQTWTSWDHYLTETDSPATPDSLFNQDQLVGPGSLLFRQGMKLEAKDRQNPGVICVATIANVKDGKLLVRFDGWSSRYDYWCRPESTDIHPPHWCNKNHRELHPPKGYVGPFKWSEYLQQPGPVPAPAFIFTEEQRAVPSDPPASPPSPSPPFPSSSSSSSSSLKRFKVGMRLEAKDRQYPTLVCVATIAAVKGNKLLIHFDGWQSGYDYLCEPESADIHPVGWCKKKGRELQKPKGYSGDFKWERYLSENGYEAAPDNIFTKAQRK